MTEHAEDCPVTKVEPETISDLVAVHSTLIEAVIEALCTCAPAPPPITHLEVTVTRGNPDFGDLDFVRYNDELMSVLEGPLEAGKGAGFTAWQRFRRAHKMMMEAVEALTESSDPFTLTLQVLGKSRTRSLREGLWSEYTDTGQKTSRPNQEGPAPVQDEDTTTALG